MTFRYLHDCGGINACGPAWDEFGWECVGMTEVEKFPIAVVKHHYPKLTQYGDTTKLKGFDLTARIDLLVGGTPCQGFSVAGKRGGLDDVRSNLAWNFLRLAAESRARWIVWENVPGASSTNEGQDLLAFTQEVGKLGYGFAWRTLDAQYFGVPQRRRRIFLVGYLGDWRPAAAVLFDPQSLRGNLAPGKKTGERTSNAFEIGHSGNRETAIAPTLDARCKDGPIRNQVGLAVAHSFAMVAFGEYGDGTKASTLKQRDFKDATDFVVMDMRGNGDEKLVNTLTGDHASRPTDYTPIVFTHKDSLFASSRDVAPTMLAKNHKDSHTNDSSSLAVFLPGQSAKAGSIAYSEHLSPTLKSGDSGTNRTPALHAGGTVRRLTPLECGRLQGFPDNWCQIPWKGKPAAQCPDGPQYKAYGNSIAVPCLRDLGRKIQIVERLLRSSAHA